ncbi:uncharacterized protein BJ171DRAFT_311789 [Polychytrium aggregatum]|uniref:uncharacterized protein n=1 Tax=Polychytrium aggregatum TaxID=110093 RepID=UPI0022FE1CCF|nr:uncharacterized protein BJ171DRAFT_311789 [Polychytrium aggregatum]KAI9207097.1 hypothetical protein BJ171DRAFT_311789 [Polychytrium aggregatum]
MLDSGPFVGPSPRRGLLPVVWLILGLACAPLFVRAAFLVPQIDNATIVLHSNSTTLLPIDWVPSVLGIDLWNTPGNDTNEGFCCIIEGAGKQGALGCGPIPSAPTTLLFPVNVPDNFTALDVEYILRICDVRGSYCPISKTVQLLPPLPTTTAATKTSSSASSTLTSSSAAATSATVSVAPSPNQLNDQNNVMDNPAMVPLLVSAGSLAILALGAGIFCCLSRDVIRYNPLKRSGKSSPPDDNWTPLIKTGSTSTEGNASVDRSTTFHRLDQFIDPREVFSMKAPSTNPVSSSREIEAPPIPVTGPSSVVDRGSTVDAASTSVARDLSAVSDSKRGSFLTNLHHNRQLTKKLHNVSSDSNAAAAPAHPGSQASQRAESRLSRASLDTMSLSDYQMDMMWLTRSADTQRDIRRVLMDRPAQFDADEMSIHENEKVNIVFPVQGDDGWVVVSSLDGRRRGKVPIGYLSRTSEPDDEDLAGAGPSEVHEPVSRCDSTFSNASSILAPVASFWRQMDGSADWQPGPVSPNRRQTTGPAPANVSAINPVASLPLHTSSTVQGVLDHQSPGSDKLKILQRSGDRWIDATVSASQPTSLAAIDVDLDRRGPTADILSFSGAPMRPSGSVSTLVNPSDQVLPFASSPGASPSVPAHNLHFRSGVTSLSGDADSPEAPGLVLSVLRAPSARSSLFGPNGRDSPPIPPLSSKPQRVVPQEEPSQPPARLSNIIQPDVRRVAMGYQATSAYELTVYVGEDVVVESEFEDGWASVESPHGQGKVPLACLASGTTVNNPVVHSSIVGQTASLVAIAAPAQTAGDSLAPGVTAVPAEDQPRVHASDAAPTTALVFGELGPEVSTSTTSSNTALPTTVAAELPKTDNPVAGSSAGQGKARAEAEGGARDETDNESIFSYSMEESSTHVVPTLPKDARFNLNLASIIKEHVATNPDELTVAVGEHIELIEMKERYVLADSRHQGRRGWVPIDCIGYDFGDSIPRPTTNSSIAPSVVFSTAPTLSKLSTLSHTLSDATSPPECRLPSFRSSDTHNGHFPSNSRSINLSDGFE